MKKAILVTFILCMVSLVLADNVRGITMDFVTIGNPGNVVDFATGYGSVDHVYSIGKYEVTVAQWNQFTATVGVPTGNPSNAYNLNLQLKSPQMPINYVSWYEATQFCNYLTSGDKSRGVYQWSGDNINPGDFLGINRSAAQRIYGTIYFLPTENEWYKAAYYKPNGSGYARFSNGTNSAPIPGVECNNRDADMNFSPPWNVGTGREEQNGTFDILGNIFEHTETKLGSEQVIRGGAYWYSSINLASSYRISIPTYSQTAGSGFRVASIPEPCTLLLLGLGGLLFRKR